jgi:hypothetical protein
MPVKYVEVDEVMVREPRGTRRNAWGVRYPGQGADGYGKKITTRYIVRIGNRWYRVYCTQISNAGSMWINYRDGRRYLMDAEFSKVKEQS